MKQGLAQLVGKQIAAVVFAENAGGPRQQVFLAFSDGTSFEFSGEKSSCNARLDRAAAIAASLEDSGATVRKVFGDVAATMPAREAATESTTLEALLDRDLGAWRLAKAAIARARSL